MRAELRRVQPFSTKRPAVRLTRAPVECCPRFSARRRSSAQPHETPLPARTCSVSHQSPRIRRFVSEGARRSAARGQGNEAASAAWKEVVKAGPSALPAVLAATGTAARSRTTGCGSRATRSWTTPCAKRSRCRSTEWKHFCAIRRTPASGAATGLRSPAPGGRGAGGRDRAGAHSRSRAGASPRRGAAADRLPRKRRTARQAKAGYLAGARRGAR